MTVAVDELIEAKWVIPIEPYGLALEDHAIAIASGRIVALCPIDEARAKFDAAKRTVRPTHAVLPGLINLHTHAAMALMRGFADDLALEPWLKTRVWPVEQALLSYEFVLAGTRLACAEMLKGGVTCFNDMYFFPDAAARSALETGIRASLGIVVIDFPTAWGANADQYLQKGLQVRDRLAGEERISFCLAPHAPYTVGDAALREIAVLSAQLNIPIHIHLHETAGEVERSVAETGMRPVDRIAELGLVGPQLIAVHGVHFNARDIETLARGGATLAHCPASNLKLASGIAPIAQCLDAGLAVGLGTDGAASNNRLDVMAEMRLAALLAKGASGRADVYGAHAVLRSATLAGATALGQDARIGSIIPGKDADLVTFDLGGPDTQPCFDPASQLVYSAGREQVCDVWITGQAVVQMRQLVLQSARDAEAEGAASMLLWQNRVESQISPSR